MGNRPPAAPVAPAGPAAPAVPPPAPPAPFGIPSTEYTQYVLNIPILQRVDVLRNIETSARLVIMGHMALNERLIVWNEIMPTIMTAAAGIPTTAAAPDAPDAPDAPAPEFPHDDEECESTEDLEGIPNCPVCLTREWKHPVAFKCGHAVCRPCLNKLMNTQNKKCPVCRYQVKFRFNRTVEGEIVNSFEFGNLVASSTAAIENESNKRKRAEDELEDAKRAKIESDRIMQEQAETLALLRSGMYLSPEQSEQDCLAHPSSSSTHLEDDSDCEIISVSHGL